MLHYLNRWMDRRKMMGIFWAWVCCYPLMGITSVLAGTSLWPFLVAILSLLLLVLLGGFCMLRMKLGIPV